MMWLLQPAIDWAASPSAINATFVLVYLAATFDACPRRVAAVSAILYVLLTMQ